MHAIGLIAEAGSSVSFVNRSECPYITTHDNSNSGTVGLAKTNELLLFGKRKTAQELLMCGFYK